MLVRLCVLVALCGVGGNACGGLYIGSHALAGTLTPNGTLVVVAAEGLLQARVYLEVACAPAGYRAPPHRHFVTFVWAPPLTDMRVVSDAPLPIVATRVLVGGVAFAAVQAIDGLPLYARVGTGSDATIVETAGVLWLRLVRGFTENTTGLPRGAPPHGTATGQQNVQLVDRVFTYDLITSDAGEAGSSGWAEAEMVMANRTETHKILLLVSYTISGISLLVIGAMLLLARCSKTP